MGKVTTNMSMSLDGFFADSPAKTAPQEGEIAMSKINSKSGKQPVAEKLFRQLDLSTDGTVV